MMFFTVLGVIAFIYFLVGIGTVGYGFYDGELTIEELNEDPWILVLILMAWPVVIMEELGYL